MLKFHLENLNTVTDRITGEEYKFPFTFGGEPCWADGQSVEGKFSKGGSKNGTLLGKMLRLKIQDGMVVEARLARKGEDARGAGRYVTNEDLTIEVENTKKLLTEKKKWEKWAEGSEGELPPFSAEKVAKKWDVTFESKVYEIGEEAVSKAAMLLPDGRVVALFQTPSGGVLATALHRDGAPAGPATLKTQPVASVALAVQEVASVALAVQEVRPPSADEMKDLFLTSEEATAAAERAPIVNVPIVFALMGYTNKSTAQTTLSRIRCIPLARVFVPEQFGAPRDQDDNDRYAYLALVIAPGCLGSDRDEKGFEVKTGTVVWIDEKYDLRPMARYLPRVNGEGHVTRASLVDIEPRGKVPFTIKSGTKAGKVAQTWRINLRFVWTYQAPEKLAKIAAMVENLPPLPFMINEIEAAGETVDDPTY